MSEFENIKTLLLENGKTLERALDECYAPDPSANERLIEVQRYGILGGGKRIRAFLTLESARLLGAEKNAALPYACALEMIHASSLVHDDMECMDNDETRRGRAAVHTEYGEAMALISGDAMCVKAFGTAATNPHTDFVTNAQAVAILAESAGERGMLAGQTVDIFAASTQLNPEEIIDLHSLKTGRLICAAVKLGCLAAGVSESDEKCLSLVKYAKNIGLAFQITDDILDFENGEHELNSVLSFMSTEEAREYANKLTEEAIEAVRDIDDGTLSELARYLLVRKS